VGWTVGWVRNAKLDSYQQHLQPNYTTHFTDHSLSMQPKLQLSLDSTDWHSHTSADDACHHPSRERSAKACKERSAQFVGGHVDLLGKREGTALWIGRSIVRWHGMACHGMGEFIKEYMDGWMNGWVRLEKWMDA